MYIIPAFIDFAGCPQICAFCNQRNINRQESFSFQDVVKQVDKYLFYLKDKPNIDKELAFYGGTFTGIDDNLQEEILSYALKLKNKKIIKKIRLSTRPDYINEKVVKRLIKYEVDLVELGVQSFDDKVLLKAQRGHDSTATFSAVEQLKKSNIAFGIQIMVGLPGQDFSSVIDTTEKVIGLKPSVARIYPFLILKDTQFAIEYEAGAIEPLDIETAVRHSAYIYKHLINNNIKVIRIGLQDDIGLRENSNVIAGPYHPAIGELVESYLYFEKIVNFMDTIEDKENIKKILVKVNKKELSKVIGQKKINIRKFKEIYQNIDLQITAHELNDFEIYIEG